MSKFLNLNAQDYLKGFLVAALTVILTGVYTSLIAVPPHFPTGSELQSLLIAGLAAGIGYLIKNLFTNSQGKISKTEN